VFGNRPLSVAELEVALCLETNIGRWHDLAGDVRFLCGPLVTIHGDQIQMVHTTARDFVRAFATRVESLGTGDILMDDRNAEHHLAIICVQFLLREETFTDFSNLLHIRSLAEYLEKMEKYLQRKPFLSYAARYWAQHLRCVQSPESVLSAMASEFLGVQWRRHAIMCLTYYFNGRYSIPSLPTALFDPTPSSGLHLAAYFNLHWIVEKYLFQGVNPDVEASSKDTPLVWASETGSTESVKTLLQAGANPNKFEFDGWSALHWAAANGHEAVAELLLNAGAMVNVRDGKNLSPIDWAVERDHWRVVTAIQQRKAGDNRGVSTYEMPRANLSALLKAIRASSARKSSRVFSRFQITLSGKPTFLDKLTTELTLEQGLQIVHKCPCNSSLLRQRLRVTPPHRKILKPKIFIAAQHHHTIDSHSVYSTPHSGNRCLYIIYR